MQTKIIERYFFFGLLLTAFVFAFFIFRPFWVVLVLGMSFAIILHPIHAHLVKNKIPDWLSALLTVFLFLIVLGGPVLGIGTIVFKQSQGLYHSIVDAKNVGPFFDALNVSVNKFLPVGTSFDVNAKVSDFISFVSGNITNIFTTTFSAVFSFIMMLFAIFYFLKDGASWRKSIVILSPLADTDDEKIIEKLVLSINGVMKGILLKGILQGLVIGLGLYFFGVPSPALWGVVAAVASIIPVVGTGFVSIPSIIFLLITRSPASAIGLALWAIVLTFYIDNVLSPLFVSKKIDMPPLLILFSVIGGLSLLGPIGVLMGPLSVSLLYALVSIYRHEFQNSLMLK